MEEYISKAFQTLEDLDISVDDIVLNEDDESSDGGKTIKDLIVEESSYNIVHDITIDDVPYSLYIECTNDGESCDATFGEFDINNVDGMIVDLLDADRNFIGTIHDISLDTTIDEATSVAKELASGEDTEKEVVEPTEDASEEEKDTDEEEPDSNTRLFIGGKEVEEPEESTEEVEVKEESLNESKMFDISDSEQVKEAEEELNKVEEDEPIEQIIDINADDESDLKKEYSGKVLLQCPICNSIEVIDKEDLVQSEDDEEVYNVDDVCTKCGKNQGKGFKLIGKVAPIEGEKAEEPEEPKEDTEIPEEPKDEPVKEEEPKEDEEKPTEETPSKPEPIKEPELDKKEGTVTFESLDEHSFNHLVKRYLNETYTNIKDYETTSAYIDDEHNTIIMEGKLTFNSGKEKKTRFTFEAKELTKKGKIKFVGLNETFTDKKAFTLSGEVLGKKLLSENLSYNYKINDNKVSGRINFKK